MSVVIHGHDSEGTDKQMDRGMARIKIPVEILEFDEGGNTIWIHGPAGATVLRLKTMKSISVNRECQNICSHVDVICHDEIEVCVAEDVLVE